METKSVTTPLEPTVESIERLILERVGSALRHLKVIALPGELVLTGSSLTWYGKQLAAQVALNTSPGCHVINDIEVG